MRLERIKNDINCIYAEKKHSKKCSRYVARVEFELPFGHQPNLRNNYSVDREFFFEIRGLLSFRSNIINLKLYIKEFTLLLETTFLFLKSSCSWRNSFVISVSFNNIYGLRYVNFFVKFFFKYDLFAMAFTSPSP
jgi:hypothetical protein